MKSFQNMEKVLSTQAYIGVVACIMLTTIRNTKIGKKEIFREHERSVMSVMVPQSKIFLNNEAFL